MIAANLRGQFSQFAGSSDNFPSPWNDVASLAMPTNHRSALAWAEFLFSQMGTYRMAMERVIAYFLTDVEIRNASEDESEKWKKFLTETLGIHALLQTALRDMVAYGNCFCSLVVPIKRFLSCPKCGGSFLLREVVDNSVFNFEWSIPNFIATCPRCKTGAGYRGPWRVQDRDDDEEKKLRVKRWNPHEMELLHDPYTEDVDYIWRIPEDYKALIHRGHLFHLERVSAQVIKAIHLNQVYRFQPGAVFHLKEPTLGGILNRGWGIPRIFFNFRQIYYIQVLHRFNEALALDYVMPFRVLTPQPRPGSSAGGGMTMDPVMMYNMGDFKSQVTAMIRKRRRDPAAMQVLPFPVQYQIFGADAKQLAPRELLDQAYETLLNDSGTPIELYNGSLQLQAAPVALRLFESTWYHLVHGCNALLRWLTQQIGQVLNWEVVDAALKRVTIADNLELQMSKLQLYMSQAMSGTTAFAALGDDWKKEQKALADESKFQATLQARVQEELQDQGIGAQISKGQIPGQAPAGAAPAGQGQTGAPPDAGMAMPMGAPVTDYIASMGKNTPVTPQDMLAAADSLAQELLGLPSGTRRQQLGALKIHNAVLHGVVTKRLEDIRSQAGSQGRQQVMQQTYGQA